MEPNKNNPKVTSSEIADWEKRFKENVSNLVKFDKFENGFSMKVYNGESGIDASWKGTIILKADEYIKWTFTLLNEPFIEAKFALNNDTQQIIPDIYKFYETWKKEWADNVTMSDEQVFSKEKGQSPAPLTATTGQLAGPENINATTPPPITEGIKIKVARTKENIIRDNVIRMKKLAGL